VTTSIFSNLSAYNLTYTSFALSNRTGTQISGEAGSKIMTMINKGDIVVYWEGLNDMRINDLSGSAAFNNVISYLNIIKTINPTVIICTVIATDKVSDPAALMNVEIPAYNTLVRSNASVYGYTVCDLAADPMFDTRSDASNATNYMSDYVHLLTPGNANVITLITNTVLSVL
jgi:hypothetical protein